MKVTMSIAVGTFVVLFLQLETPMAQLEIQSSCPQPKCRDGAWPDGTCRCNGYFDSTCPAGFDAVQNDHNHCSCESRIQPTCKPGFSLLNTRVCKCTIRRPPTCPTGSSLYPSTALCTGEHEPYCPRGYVMHECRCVKEYVRQCSSGTLSKDGCKCSSTYTPTCSSGCRLDVYGGCNCKSEIKCFDGLYCSGWGKTVNSVYECCNGVIGIEGPIGIDPTLTPGAEISSISHSYRIGDGTCTRCFH